MAARVGITKDQVIKAGIQILRETNDPTAVSMSAIASKIGIRVQSMYAHIDGSSALQRELALFSLDVLAARLTEAAIGISGTQAVRAIIQEQLKFAIEQPGMFAASIFPPGSDSEIQKAIQKVNHPMHKVLEQEQIREPQLTHWSRLVLSTIYGFAMLHRDDQLTLPIPPQNSMTYLLDVLVTDIERELKHLH
ncbi:MAG: WHG domain-containing protein [Acidimicrobiales bacterium]|jgi:AcrR family transcriptional regulator|nr:WHG domain-containing protein [Acidimicrobiales bacterium]MDP6298786.1 WHG domain-containing protein [Acidimicrobiales bacterium]HJM27668.1 WHG domain-containing protein [Acidimicrobiales bacterium]HJM97078.1 WHG domain-containing protein [Acidimicrobiales bacterium]